MNPFDNDDQGLERLDFADFVEILKLIAPELKCAIFKRIDSEVDEADIIVSFGRFIYTMRVNKAEQEVFLMKTFLTQAKQVKKLKINTFTGGTRLEWEKFFQENPLEYFQFAAQNQLESDTFFNDFISILPMKLEQIGLNFWENWFTDELDEDKGQKIVEVCLPFNLK